jgi:ABC-type multidrug transport system ATPase subunit
MCSLDEPFDGVDPPSRHAIGQLINAVAKEGECSVVMTTHRAEDILPVFTHVTVVSDGVVKRFGPAAEFEPQRYGPRSIVFVDLLFPR